MPPRRGALRKQATEPARSQLESIDVDALSKRVDAALATWDSTGREDIMTLVTTQISENTASFLSSIPLSNTLLSLLSSALSAQDLAHLFSSLLQSFDERQVEAFGESLLDLVEVLEETREDTEIEDGVSKKSLEVVKLLLPPHSTVLPSYLPNLLLSPPLLLALGLHPTPHNPVLLQRAFVKRNTTLFFKQSKYNLLRESSEGFSRLIVLLTGPDALSDNVNTSRNRADRVWSRVMGLIGYFNLSPPRVLDIILEIASCHVAAHWRFFLDLLQASPWGKSDENESNRVIAQVLGFKFGFYQRPDGGDSPVGLVYIAALLVKHKFVSLADLLPFLSPDDAEMANIRQRHLISVSSRSGPSNALANSVLLDDDTPASVNAAEATGPPPKPPPEQRIQLLHALLAIGDISSSLYFLAKYPWVAQSHPPIADLVLRIVAFAIEPVYRAMSVDTLFDLETAPLHIDSAPLEVVPTLITPVPPATSTKRFEFFYPDWANQNEVWASPEDVYLKGLRWLSLVRGLGGRAVDLMVKICRIAESHFATLKSQKEEQHGTKDRSLLDPTPQEMEPWLDLIRLSLLPSLSVSNVTAAFDVELWNLLTHFPYQVRYCLYGEWRDSTCNFKGRNSCPAASSAATECTRDIKKALSRVTAAGSASQERGPARSLAKLSHSNPCALWTTAVNQVKAYTNIGQFIVEAGRYMTQLSMDVATFTLVDTLSDDLISRLNPQGTGVAQWLESLSTFVGDFNRRYGNMDLEPVLQFVINRLMRGESADLTILGSLISVMSGASIVLNFAVSEEQMQAYATGREMIREAFYSTQIAIPRPLEDGAVKPKEAPVEKVKNVKKSLPRLVNALRETKLAMPIWIALAQTRQGAVDRMSSAPLKAMEIMQDSCHDIFIQYGDLLSEQLTADEHLTLSPDLTSLVADFGLEFAMAFQILRPKLNAAIDRARSEERAAVAKRLLAEKQVLTQRLASPNTQLPGSPPLTAQIDSEMQGDDDDEEPPLTTISTSIPPPKLSRSKVWWPTALQSTMEEARLLLPQDVNDVLGAPFFVIYWQLQVADIIFSPDSYSKAIERIRRLDVDIASWKTAGSSEARAERSRLKARIEQLAKERDTQQALVNGPIRRRLRLESSKWFGKSIVDRGQQRLLAIQLHQCCFYPRAILTPADASFVAKFIRLAHDLGTVGFSTVFAYNNFFSDQLAACIFSCTESEARNLGRCLALIMADLDAWHQDEARYTREALGLSDTPTEGVKQQPLPGMFFRAKPKEDMKPMTWQQFRNFYAKCHNILSRALVSCWKEADFMHTKNAVTVGLQVLKNFPVMDTNGKAIESAVKNLVSTRDGSITADVQALCQSYLLHLKKRQTTRPFVSPATFHSAGAKAVPVPTKPAVEETASQTPIPISTNGDTHAATPVVPTAPSVLSASDPKALRAKLEAGRNSRTASAAAKDDAKIAAAPETPAKRGTSPAPAGFKSDAPPTGPRASRPPRDAPPSGPAAAPLSNRSANASANGPASDRTVPPAPLSRGSSTDRHAAMDRHVHPDRQPSVAMGPPTELSIDEARAAARARKFGLIATAASTSLTGQPASRSSPPPPTSNPATPAPTGPSSQAGRTKRSGSVESRVSERSRREKEGDRERDDRRDSATPAARPPSRSSTIDDERARRDRPLHDDKEGRRTPRENRRDEREREDRRRDRDARETKEGREAREGRERNDRRAAADDELKRKREEDDSRRSERMGHRDERREDRRDDRRDERPRREERRDERDDHRRDGRNRERDRVDRSDRERLDVRETREAREIRDARERDARETRQRDRTPKADPPPTRTEPAAASVPPSASAQPPTGSTDTSRLDRRDSGAPPVAPASAERERIVEPRQSRRGSPVKSDRPQHMRTDSMPGRPHGLPTRPESMRDVRDVRDTRDTRDIRDSRDSRPDRGGIQRGPSLAARMGLSTNGGGGLPPVEQGGATSSPARREGRELIEPREPRELIAPRETPSERSDQRKRPLEESGPPSREDSPGSSKRIRINRERARAHGDRRDNAGGRLLAGAMRAAASGESKE